MPRFKARKGIARIPAATERIHELENLLSSISSARSAHQLYGWIVKAGEGGSYRIKEKLDEGGMGEIYRAVRTDGKEAGRIVAIKFVSEKMLSNPQMLERFRRETQTLRRIDHPNAVRIIDSGEMYDRSVKKPFIVMEYIEGEDSSILLRKRRPNGGSQALLLGIASGLVEAHKPGHPS
jgi:serine/threonine-protein kinase